MMNTTISADYVWDLAQSLSLDNQKWLANKLHESIERQEESLPPYTMEELDARIDEALEDIKAGRVYSSEEVHRMMENKYPWLCK